MHNSQFTIDNRFVVYESLDALLESQCVESLQLQLILLKGSNGIGLYKLIPYL